MVPISQIDIIRIRERAIDTECASCNQWSQGNDLARLGNRNRTQQHCVRQTIDSRSGANADRERTDRDDGESGVLAQNAERVANVSKHRPSGAIVGHPRVRSLRAKISTTWKQASDPLCPVSGHPVQYQKAISLFYLWTRLKLGNLDHSGE